MVALLYDLGRDGFIVDPEPEEQIRPDREGKGSEFGRMGFPGEVHPRNFPKLRR